MSYTVFCLALFTQAIAMDPAAELRIESALLTLIEHADVSASEAGVIRLLAVKEGEIVAEGTPLARIDDRDAKVLRTRAMAELQFAQLMADNDIKSRFAKLSVAVADAELTRAKESNAKFPKSVSHTEIDRLKLLSDKALLEVEQAEFDHQQARLTVQIKQQELERATLALERRSITAPFPGMVVQWKKQHGEWVEPGTPVMRLIRLNRLRAEAFISLKQLPADLIGRPATLIVEVAGRNPMNYSGKLVYVSPEIDPVNGQARIWAEFENPDITLRPGQSGTLLIGAAKSTP